MQTYLVTGATGFLGSALTGALLDRGKRVIGIGRRDQGFLSARAVKDPQFILRKLDLTQDVTAALSEYKIETIFHLAAQQPSSPALSFDDFYKGNVSTTRNVITLAKQSASQLIYVSTIAVCGVFDKELSEDVPAVPSNYYGLTKYIAERLIEIELQRTNVQATVVRFPSLFGRNHLGGMIYTYYQLAKEAKPIEVYGRGETLRNALYVDDAIDALCRVAEKKEILTPFEIFLVGSANSLPMARIAEYVRDYLHSSSKVVLIDKPSSPPWDVNMNIGKIKQRLGFSPMTLEDGIKKYIESMPAPV
ncbi:NAD(P)-dependent oxidoreductase [Candidatus Uhrbacteria bacterium]|nr:NAD(P)-dependent oxidoreductase [Candidatus Uhrbacteria bacterium]